MKNNLIYCTLIFAIIFSIGCSENNVDGESEMLENVPVLSQRSSAVDCGRVEEDFEKYFLCELTQETRIIQPFSTSTLPSSCSGVRISYKLTVCFHGTLSGANGNIASILITDIEIDWAWLFSNCPELQLPQSPEEQIDFLEQIRRDFTFALEQVVLRAELQNAPNGLCSDGDTEPVQVSRVEASCYTWCRIESPPGTPMVVRQLCDGSKCCELSRTYCIEQQNPIKVKLLSEEIVNLGGSCVISQRCLWPASRGCDNSCESIFR